jgi:hypothetical protein
LTGRGSDGLHLVFSKCVFYSKSSCECNANQISNDTPVSFERPKPRFCSPRPLPSFSLRPSSHIVYTPTLPSRHRSVEMHSASLSMEFNAIDTQTTIHQPNVQTTTYLSQKWNELIMRESGENDTTQTKPNRNSMVWYGRMYGMHRTGKGFCCCFYCGA